METDFLREIEADIDWRYAQLSTLKTIPVRYGLFDSDKQFLIQYSPVIIYSLWEGFVKHAFEEYISKLNALKLDYRDLPLELLTHAISTQDKLKLENARQNFKSKYEFVEYLKNYINTPLHFTPKLPTKSNIDFKVINDILNRFNLKKLPEEFKRSLDKLLRFRNTIAHGDNSIPTTLEDVATFSQTVIDLMTEIFIRIEEGYKAETYISKYQL